MTYKSIPVLLRTHAQSHPHHPALIFDDGNGPVDQLSYAELAQRVDRLAGAMMERGWEDRPVALLFGPGIDFVAAFLACLTIGAIAVPLAPIGRRRERVANLLPVILDCDPAALLLDAAMADQYAAFADLLPPQGIAFTRLAELEEASVSAILPSPSADTLAVLQYTSGSTSAPKGVMITHGNIMANQRMIARAFGHDRHSDFVGWAPHFHDQGLFGNILQPLYLGSTCVLTAPATFIRRPLVWLDLIHRYRAHTSGGPNFAFDLCVEQARSRGLPAVDLSCWTVAFNGAEPIRASSVQRFAERFAPAGFASGAFFPCYGLAECTVVTACGPRNVEPLFRSNNDLIQTCCGPIMDESEVVIVDTATLQPVPDGAVGEIWISGPHVGTGYWQRPEASKETFAARLADGRGPWLRTGDIGSLTSDGLYVTGRIKDLLIVRGRNYAPSDVEQLWADTFNLSGQATSAAFQVEQEDGSSHVVLLGEVDRAARASTTLHADITALAQQIRKLALERLDLSITDLVVVAPSGVPRTTSGKVRRTAARQMLLAGELPVIGGTGPLMPSLKVAIQS